MQSGILEITLNPGCVYGNSRDVTNLFLVSGIATLSVMCTALQYVEALLITPNRISYLSPALITFVIARFRRNLTLTTLAVKSSLNVQRSPLNIPFVGGTTNTHGWCIKDTAFTSEDEADPFNPQAQANA